MREAPEKRRPHWVGARKTAKNWAKRNRDHDLYEMVRGLLDNLQEWEVYLGGVHVVDRSKPYALGEPLADGRTPPEGSSFFTARQLAGMALAGTSKTDPVGSQRFSAALKLVARAEDFYTKATWGEDDLSVDKDTPLQKFWRYLSSKINPQQRK